MEPVSNHLGTQNLKEIVDFSLCCGEVLAGLADGVDFADLGPALNAAKKAPPAFKDAALALKEYQDMSDAEAKELEDFVVADFDIPQESVEKVIEIAFSIAIQLHVLFEIKHAAKVVPA